MAHGHVTTSQFESVLKLELQNLNDVTDIMMYAYIHLFCNMIILVEGFIETGLAFLVVCSAQCPGSGGVRASILTT